MIDCASPPAPPALPLLLLRDWVESLAPLARAGEVRPDHLREIVARIDALLAPQAPCANPSNAYHS